MKEIARLIIVLTVICAVAAAALSAVYTMTKDPIAKAAREEKLSAMRQIMPGFDNEPDAETVSIPNGKDEKGNDITRTYYIARKGEEVIGVLFETSSPAGYGGTINVIVGVTTGGEITGVVVLKHSETPGLGAKITNPEWLAKFAGRSLQNTRWAVTKDGGDIDYTSGATISPRAVVAAIKDGLDGFERHKDEIISKAGEFTAKK
jgi:Na+-translocating ferredoxin:NAD+ oxidoreductase subunit G